MMFFLLVIVIMAAVSLLGLFFRAAARADKKLVEMADVFRIPFSSRLKYIYLPEIKKMLHI